MRKASKLRFNPAYFQLSSRHNSNRSLSASVSQAIQEMEVLHKHIGQWHKTESGSNCFYKHPGYKLEPRVEIAISL